MDSSYEEVVAELDDKMLLAERSGKVTHRALLKRIQGSLTIALRALEARDEPLVLVCVDDIHTVISTLTETLTSHLSLKVATKSDSPLGGQFILALWQATAIDEWEEQIKEFIKEPTAAYRGADHARGCRDDRLP